VACSGYIDMRKGRRRKSIIKVMYLPTCIALAIFEIFRFGVFELLMQKNGQKCDKNKSKGGNDREKVFPLQFFCNKFLTCIFPNFFFHLFYSPF
jgi:hypothetical protein